MVQTMFRNLTHWGYLKVLDALMCNQMDRILRRQWSFVLQ